MKQLLKSICVLLGFGLIWPWHRRGLTLAVTSILHTVLKYIPEDKSRHLLTFTLLPMSSSGCLRGYKNRPALRFLADVEGD